LKYFEGNSDGSVKDESAKDERACRRTRLYALLSLMYVMIELEGEEFVYGEEMEEL